MSETIPRPRTKRYYKIVHNSTSYDMDLSIGSMAVKKAHIMVRDFLKKDWQRTGKNTETTASILADDKIVATIYGFRKNNKIHIVHL